MPPGPTSSGEIAKRIVSLRDPAEPWGEFAVRVGLTPQVVSNFRRRGYGASLETVVSVVCNTSVNPEWLLTGAGPRWLPSKILEEDPRGAYSAGLLDAAARMEELLGELRREAGRGPAESAPAENTPGSDGGP